MRLLLVVCIAVLVAVFVWSVYTTLTSACELIADPRYGIWCLPDRVVA